MSVEVRISLKELPYLRHLGFPLSADISVYGWTDGALGVSGLRKGCQDTCRELRVWRGNSGNSILRGGCWLCAKWKGEVAKPSMGWGADARPQGQVECLQVRGVGRGLRYGCGKCRMPGEGWLTGSVRRCDEREE